MILPLLIICAAIAFFVMGVCEISFPELFSWVEILSDSFPKLYRYATWLGIAQSLLGCLLLIPAWRLNKSFTRRMLETLFRIGLGGMFVFAAWGKLMDPKTFAILVAQYQFLPHMLINPFALLLPQLEFWFGLALIVSPWNRESALAIFLMFLAFIIALISALWRDLGITCGCFILEGAQSKSEAWTTLIRDIILLAPTLWLTQRPNRFLWKIWQRDS